MTWEETIKHIRTLPEFKMLVEKAYFEEDLPLNVERFRESEEFLETLALLSEYKSLDSTIKLLDIGSGNGISSVAFALKGIKVDTVEPDPSETIGAGAIRKLKEHYLLTNMNVYQAFAEELKFPDNSYDIVYVRQCMHHAHDLKKFLLECSRVLKKGGILLTVRDHVVYNKQDKEWFLENHPLQKFYGGENAFSEDEYKAAIQEAGLTIKITLKHFESVINYFPLSKEIKESTESKNQDFIDSVVQRKLGVLSKVKFIRRMAELYVESKVGKAYDETKIPGRVYTFIAIKE
jgi:ubiquinone/menaquinone biosynthesis C-methylase UbiE